jgi:transcriptional regulator with XRE-family HTH domain
MKKINTKMPLRTRFARNLRACRVRQDLSQEQLASIAGFSRTFVSDVEREVRNCTIDNIERLANALKVDVSALFKPVAVDAQLPEVLPKGPRRNRSAG